MDSLRRKTIQVNLVRTPPQLKELASRIPENSPFIERHGRLLNLVNTNTEEDMVKVLFQFFASVCICARFQSAPRESHLTVVKRIFKYLKGTANLGLFYRKSSDYSLVGYCDADFAGESRA